MERKPLKTAEKPLYMGSSVFLLFILTKLCYNPYIIKESEHYGRS